MFLFSLFNLLFNIIFAGILIYLIIRNNQLTKQVSNASNGSPPALQSPSTKLGTKLGTKPDTKLGTKPDTKLGTKLGTKPDLKVTKKHELILNKRLCADCVRQNLGLPSHLIRNCPHCGSENYDTGCIPAIVQKGRPTNCIPKKDFSEEQAHRACLGVSGFSQQCNLIDIKNSDKSKVLTYMKDECGEDAYYCAYDESDSCSYNLCKIDDYFAYGDYSTMCGCEPEKTATHYMGPGWGRECKRGENCAEYDPNRGAPELWTSPELSDFYRAVNGGPSYMDVPNLEDPIAQMIYDQQIA
jgi:hypothetical protein